MARASSRGSRKERAARRGAAARSEPATRRVAHELENAAIADALEELGDLLEIEGENPFRVRAYREAARTVRGLPERLADLYARGADLSELDGIGAKIAAKIGELLETGALAALKTAESRTPSALARMLHVPGLGPARVRALHEALGVETLEALRAAAEAGRVRALPGFGAATEKKILEGLAAIEAAGRRVLWWEAAPVAEAVLARLSGLPGLREAVVAGSFRRGRDTVGDLDVVVATDDPEAAIAAFAEDPAVERVLARGTTRSTAIRGGGLQVDLRAVAPESFGAALCYFTGSKQHGIALRRIALERGWKLNEYGLFAEGRRLAGKSEAGLYRELGLAYVEPELREDRGEVEAARRGELPRLVELADLRGDLHAHTTASDGRDDLETMARAAKARGHAYLAISEHTQAARVANGLSAKRLRAHLARIDALNAELRGLRLLRAAEVEILEDGSLDLPDALLAELDLVLGAVHFPHGLSASKQTDRLLRAMDHPRLHVLAHPTGRLIGQRAPMPLELERLIAGAAERGVILELNSQPGRADLDDEHARMATEAGVRLAISSDAHAAAQLDLLRFGVLQARRAWVRAESVVNTRTWRGLSALLRR